MVECDPIKDPAGRVGDPAQATIRHEAVGVVDRPSPDDLDLIPGVNPVRADRQLNPLERIELQRSVVSVAQVEQVQPLPGGSLG